MRATWIACTGSLVVGMALVPQTVAATDAAAAETSCPSAVATYVVQQTSSNPAAPRTLSKYVDWGAKSGESGFLSTGHTAQVSVLDQLFSAPNGVIYKIDGFDSAAPLKVYKDNTATGGALMTPVTTNRLDWRNAEEVWSNGARIFVANADGTISVYRQTAPSTGDGLISLVATLRPSTEAAEIISAEDVWMVGSTIYTLSADGTTIAHRTYSETTDAFGRIRAALGATVVDKTGLTGVTHAWSPGPGAINTQTITDDPDTTGRIAKHTTEPFTTVNSSLATGITGYAMADTASCLAEVDTNVQPTFGPPLSADDLNVPVAQEPADEAPTTPSNTVSGKFTLGNGQPAAGMKVTLTASDLEPAVDGSEQSMPVVGSATTLADGTWKATLPATLPASVQQAMTANGGALNLTATTVGTTASGVKVLGYDALTAVPEQAATRSASTETLTTMVQAIDDGHTMPMVPNTVDDASAPAPTPEQAKQSFASITEADPQATDVPTPLWQSDRGVLPTSYNPYLVGGKDVKAEAVTSYESGTCDTLRFRKDSAIRYTVVGEAHAFWDVKATFDYDNTMSSTVDIAVNSNGDWKIGGSKQMSSETGVSTGYTNWGPYKSYQYKVPIEYRKYKHQRICSGTVRATWYTWESARYKVPSGGAVGKAGKSVSYKDGRDNYLNSPKSYRAEVKPNTYFQLTKKKSTKFGNAVNLAGVGLGVTTAYDVSHKQKISAGTKTSFKHLIWGKNGPVYETPGVFYSY
ncbi:hypothetical protein ACIHJG_40235 [Streptomyces sp. NPDC052415]|uniref:hypothetical protein n=1 Tax=Streptomyces sp. NPDC052415 TaxID=3365690 RepID=UPI0037D3AC19